MTNWKEICAKCADGEIEPTYCEYYGEPDGCNSPTRGEHPPVNNAAEMREALVALRDAARNFCHQILNSKHNEIMDKYTCAKQGFPAVIDIRDAIVRANYALAAPARNCDVGTSDEQVDRFGTFCISKKTTIPLPEKCTRCRIRGEANVHKCMFEWAQLPYTEGEK